MFVHLCEKALGWFDYALIRRRRLDQERSERRALESAAAEARQTIQDLMVQRENERAEFGKSFARLAAKLQMVRAKHARAKAGMDDAIARRAEDRKRVSTLTRLLREEHARSRMLDERLAAVRASAATASETRSEHAAAMDMVRELDGQRALEQAIRQTPEFPSQSAHQDDQQTVFNSARAYFALGRAFQAKGEITLAARAYRKAGPHMAEFLAETAPPDVLSFSGLNLMIIGAARSGTTWLRERLSLHPDIFLQPREGIYFSACPHLSLESYLSAYWRRTGHSLKTRLADDARFGVSPTLFGEKSPAYLDMPESSIELCAALFPNLRIVCLVREPVSRAWSRIKQLGLADRAGDLGHLRAQAIGNSLEEIVRQGRYQEHLRRWASHFPPKQILVIEFPRIWAEPEKVYAEVLQHLGAAPWPFPDLAHRGEKMGEANDIPDPLHGYLQTVYEGEPYDAPSLTQAMIDAAGQDSRPPHGEPLLAQVQTRSRPHGPDGAPAAAP